MRNLESKIVFITGAGSGFGRALALELAARKAIPVVADVDREGLAGTGRLLQERGARFGSQVLDVRSRDAWEQAARDTASEFGGVDVLINNAGILSRAESFLELSEDHCRALFEVNFWGMFYGTRAFVPLLALRPEAHLVNVCSSLALIGTPMASVYCASKAATANFTAVVREELAGSQIGVTAVFPGASKTNLGRNIPVDNAEQREANAKNFERFATTPAEKVARKIVAAIEHRRPVVVSGVDAHFLNWFARLAPRAGYKLMAAAYRKVSDPKLFAGLKALTAR
jgi:NAD(P)-dependent dehydrogenase (short-subunit alcohol dehydrogenase family)